MQTYDVSATYQGGYTRTRIVTRYIVVHHAAAHYKQMTGLEDVEAVRKWHMEQHNGWPGIGYHVALAEITNGGEIGRYILSDLDLQRAHILMRNHECVGISCLTDFGNTIPADKWIEALAEGVRDLRVLWPDAEIVGHKEITVPGGATRCPGDRWLEWKPRLLAMVANEPDYSQAWGMAAAFHPTWRIPRTWMRHHKELGRVLAVPFDTPGGTTQEFEHGFVRWNEAGGAVAYLPEDQP